MTSRGFYGSGSKYSSEWEVTFASIQKAADGSVYKLAPVYPSFAKKYEKSVNHPYNSKKKNHCQNACFSSAPMLISKLITKIKLQKRFLNFLSARIAAINLFPFDLHKPYEIT